MGSQANELRAHSQEGRTVRCPTKLLFLSHSPMAELCGPGQGGWRTGGTGKLRVSRRRVGRGRAISCSQKPRLYHLPLNGGTPKAEAVAPSQTSPKTDTHGLQQSGGSQGRGGAYSEDRELFPLSDQGLGLGHPGGISVSLSSAPCPHPSEGPVAGG